MMVNNEKRTATFTSGCSKFITKNLTRYSKYLNVRMQIYTFSMIFITLLRFFAIFFVNIITFAIKQDNPAYLLCISNVTVTIW